MAEERFSKGIDIPVFNRDTYDQVTEEAAQLLSQINQVAANVPETIMVEAAKRNINLEFMNPVTDFFSKAAQEPWRRLKASMLQPLNINPDTTGLGEAALKGVFFGVREAWERSFPSVGRALALQQQEDISFGEAYNKSIVSPFRLWQEAKARGEVIDFGSATFQDTKPEDTDRYKDLIDKGVDPLKARDIVLSELGVNIWTSIEEESRKISMPSEIAAALEARNRGGQATFGRVMWQPFHMIAGPEDRAYDFYTGAIDLIANLFDPTFLVGKGVKGVKAGRQLLALTDEAAQSLGLANGFVRNIFSRGTADQVINSRLGDKLADFLYQNRNNPKTILEESNFKFVNKYIVSDEQLSSDFTNFMKNLENLGELDVKVARGAVKELLTAKITREGITEQPNLRVLATATEGLVPMVQKNSRWRNLLRTYFGPQYKTNVTGRNPDALLVNYSKFLTTLDPQEKLIDGNARVRNIIKALDEVQSTDPLLRSVILVDEIVKDMNSFKEIYKEGLKVARKGKVRKGDDDMINDLFNTLTGYQKDVIDAVAKDKTVWNSLTLADDVIERVAEASGKSIDDVAQAIRTQPILETTLTQEVILPDVSKVIKLANKLDRSMGGKYKDMVGILGDSSTALFLDSFMKTIFKPLVLLRPAWTLRVVGEEQLRILADGVIGVTERPMQLLARIIGSPTKRAYKTQRGWRGGSTFDEGIAEAESRAFGGMSGFDGKIDWETVVKEGNPDKWGQGQINVITKLIGARLPKRIARIKRLEPKDQAKAYDELINDILTKGSPEYEAIQAVAVEGNNPFHRFFEIIKLGEDRVVTRDFIDLMDQHITNSLTKTGNEVVDQRLWELIETGKFTKVAKADEVEEVVDLNKIIRGIASEEEYELYLKDPKSLSTKRMKEIQEKFDDNLTEGVDKYIKEFGDLLPDMVNWKSKPIPFDESSWEKVVNWGMQTLMTERTNNLSRIPVFKAQYWKKSGELIAISSERVKQKIIAGAVKAELPKKEINKLHKIASAGDAGIDDDKLIELMAKASGVNKVKGLLYDITEKRRFWEATRFAFPFGNAYQEVITTWLGLMKANPSIAPRANTVWAGATQPTDQFEDTGKGFFYENPVNGQAVFNYPGTGLVQKYMFGDDDTTKINMPVYASSVNIAASIMPGFGPIVTLPAAFIFKNYPEESYWNNIIFGDFPAPDVSDPKSIFKSLGVLPAWLDKVGTILYNQEEDTTGIYGNTVMDTYKALIYSGQIDDSTEEGMREGMELALDKSKTLFMLRTASQFLGPAGVASPIYELKPENMDYFMFETLADEYRTIKEANNYDDATATEIFIETYGLNPLPLTVAKSVSIEKFPVTKPGYDWYKDNQDLYETYPLVAWYLEPPPIYAEFSFASYKKGILENKREYRTPEQWAIAKNKLLGAVALREYENTINIVGNNSTAARNLRNAKKKELEQRYWGYGQPSIVGQPAQPSIDMQIDQLIKMVQNPDLQENEVVIAANKYLDKRQMIIDEFVAQGMSETIWTSSSKYVGVRHMLRLYANQLMAETGNFGPLFDQLLAKELEPEYEDNLLLELELGSQ